MNSDDKRVTGCLIQKKTEDLVLNQEYLDQFPVDTDAHYDGVGE